MDITEFRARVESVMEPPLATSFIPSRYPATYAYDFYRSHGEDITGVSADSRAEAAGVVRRFALDNGLDVREVILSLADGYLRENDVLVPVRLDEVKEAFRRLGGVNYDAYGAARDEILSQP